MTQDQQRDVGQSAVAAARGVNRAVTTPRFTTRRRALRERLHQTGTVESRKGAAEMMSANGLRTGQPEANGSRHDFRVTLDRPVRSHQTIPWPGQSTVTQRVGMPIRRYGSQPLRIRLQH
jgi:hypothetical protein